MMKKTFRTLLFAAASLCCLTASAEKYKVIIPFGEDEEGAMAYMVNFDTGDKIDSVIVADKAAVFTGEIDEPVVARVLVDGQRVGTFILESGTIGYNHEHGAFGSMLNDRLKAISDSVGAIAGKFRGAATDAEREAIYAGYQKYIDSQIAENLDSPIAYYLFIQDAGSLEPAEFDAALRKYPALASYQRVGKIKESHARRQATSPGNMFADFEVEYQGKTYRLSDYVAKGRYVLVDYWASWCGPCLRQLPVLKELYSEYKDKGLDVLGVAVWDQPADTEAAIVSHELPWPCIINAGNVPTDLYGINGIPCIILYGPDGKILVRDKQGDELKAAVREFMDKK